MISDLFSTPMICRYIPITYSISNSLLMSVPLDTGVINYSKCKVGVRDKIITNAILTCNVVKIRNNSDTGSYISIFRADISKKC